MISLDTLITDQFTYVYIYMNVCKEGKKIVWRYFPQGGDKDLVHDTLVRIRSEPSITTVRPNFIFFFLG